MGFIGCKIAQNLGNFDIFKEIFAVVCDFFLNLMILLENFDQNSKNRGSLGVKL